MQVSGELTLSTLIYNLRDDTHTHTHTHAHAHTHTRTHTLLSITENMLEFSTFKCMVGWSLHIAFYPQSNKDDRLICYESFDSTMQTVNACSKA